MHGTAAALLGFFTTADRMVQEKVSGTGQLQAAGTDVISGGILSADRF